MIKLEKRSGEGKVGGEGGRTVDRKGWDEKK